MERLVRVGMERQEHLAHLVKLAQVELPELLDHLVREERRAPAVRRERLVREVRAALREVQEHLVQVEPQEVQVLRGVVERLVALVHQAQAELPDLEHLEQAEQVV